MHRAYQLLGLALLVGPAGADEVNLAPAAAVYTVPSACTDARYLCDGDENTYVRLEACSGMAGRYVFTFVAPQTVRRLRFLQRQDLNHMTAFALAAGDDDGSPATVVEGHATPGWNEVVLPKPVTARVFSLSAVKGQCGWMQAYPYLCEVELWAEPAPEREAEARRPAGGATAAPALVRPKKGRAVTITPRKENPFLKAVWVEAWMAREPGTARSKALFESVRGLGLNTVWLWGQAVGLGKEPWRVLWPSTVAEGWKSDWLAAFVKDAHQSGIKVIVTLYDGEAGVRFTPDAGPVPGHGCTLNGDWYRDRWARVFAEAVEHGADGVALCPDEFTHGGHWLAKMTDDDPCHARFKEAFGHDRAPRAGGDNDQFRDWQRFVYQSVGNLFGDFAAAVRKANPKVVTTCNISQSAYYNNLRMRLGLAYDVIFERAGIDLPGTDPYVNEEYRSRALLRPVLYAKWFAAASPTGRCTSVLNAGDIPSRSSFGRPFPIYGVYGSALGALFCDARQIVWYRHNYIFGDWQKADVAAAVRRTSAMIDELDALGFADSRTPKRIACVTSRASEDWWQLAHNGHYMLPDVECIRGFVYHRTVMEWMLRCGYPFDVLYAERADHVKRLSEYDVLVVPFPFAVSDELVKGLGAAAQKGSRVLLFGPLGERDARGRLRRTKALEPLLRRFPQQVVHDNRDLTRWGMTGEFRTFLCRTLDALLGKAKEWHFDARGHDAIMLLRHGPGGRRFALLVNHEPGDATVELGMAGELAHSRMLILDADGAHEAALAGTSPAGSPERMAVTVTGESALVVCFVPAEDRDGEGRGTP